MGNVTQPHHSCEEIARAYLGEPARRSGSELFWHDPHYPDKNPSLQVNTRKDAWSNFARDGAKGTAWTLAAYLADADPGDKKAVCKSMEERGLIEPLRQPAAEKPQPKVVATYDWGRDQNGVEVRRLRYEPGLQPGRSKSYLAQHREPGKRWEKCNGCNHKWKLYKNSFFDQSDRVLGVEGENKVAAAEALGIAAFCHKDLTENQVHEFVGHEVIFWPDKDDEGARQVSKAAKLIVATAASVRMLPPPEELPATGDIIDYIALGKGEWEVRELMAQAEDWTGKQAEPLEPQQTAMIKAWQEIPDLLSMPPERIEWVVQGILPRQSLTLITGLPSHYKSWLALALLRGVALTGSFLGRVCSKMPVLYLDRENPRAVVQSRLAILGIESSDNWKIWGRWLSDAPPMIGDPRLLEIAREVHPVIIFDSLIRFHTGEENSAKDIAQVMESLRSLVDAGATVGMLHHKGRAEGSQYRGSSDIIGGPDTAYSVTRDREAGTIKFDCFKSRYIEEFSLTIRPDLTNSGDFLVIEAPEQAEQHENVSRIAEIIQANSGITQTRIIELSGIPQARARDILQRYSGEFWRCENGNHNAKRYFLATGNA